MKVQDVMSREVRCASPNDSLTQAAQTMRNMDVGCLPVCGENEKLIGMVTDRDITIRAVADMCDPEATRVIEVMTPDISYCFESDDINSAAKMMEDKQIRRVVVLNDDHRLVGILSLGDLAVRVGENELSGQTLEQISEPVGAM